MTLYHSHFSSPLRYYKRYYPLNTDSKALFLLEAESLDTPTDSTPQTKSSSHKALIFGWGVLATLLIVGGFQFARLKDAPPANLPLSPSEVGFVIAD